MAKEDRGGLNNSEWAHREAIAKEKAGKENLRQFILVDEKKQVVVSREIKPGERVLKEVRP